MRTLLTISLLLAMVSSSWADYYFNADCATNGNGSSWSCADSPGGAGAFNDFPEAAVNVGGYTWVRGTTYWIGGSDTVYGATHSTYSGFRYETGSGRITLKKASAAAHGTDTGWYSTLGTKRAVFNLRILINISDVTISGSYRTGLESGHGIKFYGPPDTPFIDTFNNWVRSGIILEYLEMEHNATTYDSENAITLWGNGNNIIRYCNIHDISGLCVKGGLDVDEQAFEPGFENLLFEENVCGDVGKTTNTGAHLDSIKDDSPAEGVIIRNNLFYNWVSTGAIVLSHPAYNTALVANDWEIYNNIFTIRGTPPRANTSGVLVGDSSGTGGYSNIKFYNNTIANVPTGTAGGVWMNPATTMGSGNEVKNNIFYNLTDAISNHCTGSTTPTCDDNWYYLTTGYTLKTGEIAGSADPFVDSSNEDFNLATGAGPIDQGTDLSSVFATDYAGNTRDASFDIGAYEYDGGAAAPTHQSIGSGVRLSSLPVGGDSVSSSPTSFGATISVDLDTASYITISWGKDSADLDRSYTTRDSLASHTVLIPGLQGDTTYYYSVAYVDGQGRNRETSVKGFTTLDSYVKLGPNDEILVNDQQFFPIMQWCQNRSRIAYQKTLGINTYWGNGCTGETTADYQDECAAQGVMCISTYDASYEGDTNLLGWYLVDEPDIGVSAPRTTPADARAAYVTGKGNDPYRPNWLTLTSRVYPEAPLYDWMGGDDTWYIEYAMAADVLGYDNYVIYGWCHPDDWMYRVGDGQVSLRTTYARNDSTFQWIEAMRTSHTLCENDERDPADDGPQPYETKNEVWQAIVGGAKAIGYFTHSWECPGYTQWCVSSAMETMISSVNADIQALKTVILSGTPSSTVSVNSTVIDTMIKESGGKLYVFAVNEGRTTPTVTFTVSTGYTITAVSVYGESRSITPSGNAFSDSFTELAVHIYELTIS